MNDDVVLEHEVLRQLRNGYDAHVARPYRAYRESVLAAHPAVATAMSALLALGAVVALIGAYGIVAAVLGGLAWLTLPESRGQTRG